MLSCAQPWRAACCTTPTSGSTASESAAGRPPPTNSGSQIRRAPSSCVDARPAALVAELLPCGHEDVGGDRKSGGAAEVERRGVPGQRRACLVGCRVDGRAEVDRCGPGPARLWACGGPDVLA